ncbi:MAG TPA: hypothetical protein VGK49_00070, partial [Ilumatobacteraceae bacterium]
EMLLVPVGLGLALGAGSIAGGFAADVRERGFGWRQPVAVLANLAIAVALVPGVVSIGDGAWGAPRTTMADLLAAQLPEDPTAGDYRVLFVGDPRVLPVPGVEYADGIAYAVVDDGAFEFTDRWSMPETDADPAVVDALDRIASRSTLRAGQLLAPLGIRFVVVPRVDGATSTIDDPLPVPDGLLQALEDQLDIGETFGLPTLDVFENRSWMPTSALLTGATADASREAGDEALVRADLSSRRPVFVGSDHLSSATDQVEPGVVQLATPLDDRWSLTVDGADVPPRESFGVTTAFDVPAAGSATLDFHNPSSRTVLVVAQTLLWLLVVLAASRIRSPFVRRRGTLTDETLIDFDDELGPGDIDHDTESAPRLDPLVDARLRRTDEVDE